MAHPERPFLHFTLSSEVTLLIVNLADRFPPHFCLRGCQANSLIADVRSHVHLAGMKNIQIIDGAPNATFSIFQASDEEFEAIFPNGSEMEIIEDVVARLASKWREKLSRRCGSDLS